MRRRDQPERDEAARDGAEEHAGAGGGKAERFQVAREARARGVEPVELHLGDDLETFVRDAIDNGADAVGVAGWDAICAVLRIAMHGSA